MAKKKRQGGFRPRTSENSNVSFRRIDGKLFLFVAFRTSKNSARKVKSALKKDRKDIQVRILPVSHGYAIYRR